MKKLVGVLLGLAALAAGGYYAYGKWLKPAKTPATPTSTGQVERGAIRLSVTATGRVEANLEVDIKCKASGEITKLPYDLSAAVKKDALLLELDPVDQQRVLRQVEVSLAAAQARLATAQANLVVAERTLVTDRQRAETALALAQTQSDDSAAKAERLRQLFEKKLTSQEDYDTARTAAVQAQAALASARVRIEELKTQETALEIRRQDVRVAQTQVELEAIAKSVAEDRLADTKVLAPMEGVVVARNVQIGQIISSAVSNVGGGTTVLTLADLSRIFVVAAVDESDIGRVQLGQPVLVTADAFRGQRFRGQVTRIPAKGATTANVTTFDVQIEVLSDNRNLLKPEMTANVEIVCAEKNDVLLVPVEAVVRRKGQEFITRPGVNGTAATDQPVTAGISDGVKTEIVSGLQEGDRVLLHQGAPDSRWNAGGQSRPGGPPRGMMFH